MHFREKNQVLTWGDRILSFLLEKKTQNGSDKDNLNNPGLLIWPDSKTYFVWKKADS